MAKSPQRRQAPRVKRPGELVVNLEEFAQLCGITPETMREHLKAAPANAPWLIERGRRGRGYRIAAKGGVEWWRARSTEEGDETTRRAQQLAQLRLQLLGGDAGEEEMLLTGKQRYDEYRAGEAELAYRTAIGELVRAVDVEAETANAVIELRRALQGVGASVRQTFGLAREVEHAIDDAIADCLRKFVEELDADDADERDAG